MRAGNTSRIKVVWSEKHGLKGLPNAAEEMRCSSLQFTKQDGSKMWSFPHLLAEIHLTVLVKVPYQHVGADGGEATLLWRTRREGELTVGMLVSWMMEWIHMAWASECADLPQLLLLLLLLCIAQHEQCSEIQGCERHLASVFSSCTVQNMQGFESAPCLSFITVHLGLGGLSGAASGSEGALGLRFSTAEVVPRREETVEEPGLSLKLLLQNGTKGRENYLPS